MVAEMLMSRFEEIRLGVHAIPFYESNLLVVKLVDRIHMEKAVEYLANTGKYIGMVV